MTPEPVEGNVREQGAGDAKVRERLAAIYSTVAYNRSAEADKTREVLLIAETLLDRLAAQPAPDVAGLLRAEYQSLRAWIAIRRGHVTLRDIEAEIERRLALEERAARSIEEDPGRE